MDSQKLRRHSPFAMAALLLSSACGSGRGVPLADAPTRTVDAQGVEVVRNTGATAWRDTTGWRIREIRRIPIPDSGACGLGVVTSATLDDDDRLYVAGRQPLAISAFDTTGACIGRIGRSGAGPGEYRYVMLGVTHDMVLVQDPLQTRLTRYRPDGSVVSITPSPCCLLGPVLPVLQGGGVAIPMFDQGRDGWLRIDSTGQADSLRVPLEPTDAAAWSWHIGVPDGPRGELRSTDVGIPYSPTFIVQVTPLGAIVSGRTDVYRLTLDHRRGGTSRAIEATVARVAVPDSLRDAAYEFARSGAGVRAYEGPMQHAVRQSDIPHHWPLWSAVRGDPQGRLWVGLPSSDRSIGLLHVFDSTGALLGAVPVPHPGILGDQAVWQRDRIILPDVDTNGLPVVRIFAVDTTIAH